MQRVYLSGMAIGCAHRRTLEQAAGLRRTDCTEFFPTADSARAEALTRLARDLVNACPRDSLDGMAVAARFAPQVPPAEELKRRAVASWMRALHRALAVSPPEGVDVSDGKGSVAYDLALNLNSGNSRTASGGLGSPDKIASCELLLGEPAGAGIPVP
jgi:hypothetical protein